MKKSMNHRSYAVALVLAVAVLMMLAPSIASAVDFGLYRINFLGATYDAGTNSTKFTYQATAAVNYGFDCWFLELNPDCFGPGEVVDASEPWEYVDNYLGSGMAGIKFTQPYAPGESRIVWFSIKGNVIVDLVRVVLSWGCTNWFKEIDGPECGGVPEPPPGDYRGRTPGYWKHQLAVYLGYHKGRFHEPNLEDYLSQIGYDAEQAYAILDYGGSDMASKLHRQLLAAKFNIAAGYLWSIDELIDLAEYMIAHPGEFTEEQLEAVKNQLEDLNKTGE